MDYLILVIGILLIGITIWLLGLLKNIVLNSIFGALGFIVCYFFLGIKLPIYATIIASAIFGPAGLGVMLIFWFFEIV